MKIKSIIIEEIPTPNRRVYKKGSLDKFKSILQPYIENNKCFVTFGDEVNDLAVKEGSIAGFVKSFDIENGQAVFDIEVIETEIGRVLKAYIDGIENYSVPAELKADFRLEAKISEEVNEWGFNYVDLTDFDLQPYLKIIKVDCVL